MNTELRGREFEFEGTRFRLSFEDGVRDRDIREHTLTLVRILDDAVVTIRPEDFMKSAHPGPSLLSPRKHYEFREVMEKVVDLGFNPEWVGHIGRFLSDHRLLKTSKESGS